MGYMFENGNIVCDGVTYPILNVVALYSYDVSNVDNVVRMTGLEIESDAPFEINTKVERLCFNELCEQEFCDEDECWSVNAIKSIKEYLGVDDGIINIEFQ